MPEITLEPGSPSERIAIHLHTKPDSVLTRRAVATLLAITPALVDQALQAGIGLGLITAFNDADEGRCYKAGPRLKFWAPPGGKPQTPNNVPQEARAVAAAGAPAAPPAAAEKKPAAKRAPKKYLPELQLSLLKVEKNVPLPPHRGQLHKGQTKYDSTLDLLKADGDAVTGIPKAYQGALLKAIPAYMKQRPHLKCQLVVRRTDDEHIGIWRLAPGSVKTGQAAGQAKLKAA